MKYTVSMLLALSATAGAMGGVIAVDSFIDPASSSIPTGWVTDEPANTHGTVVSGSLTYPGTSSTGNSFGLGEKTADYLYSFPSTSLAGGESIYFSFLFRINEANAFTTGLFRLYDSTDQHGSGIAVGIGTSDYTSDQMGFSLNNRQRNWPHADSINTPETYDILDTTYLIVGSYTRGVSGNGSGSVDLWINPDLTLTPGATTLSMGSYQEDEDYDTFEIISAGSGSFVPDWQMDELKIGTSWSDVVEESIVAVPEPGALPLLLGLAAIGLGMRRRS
jgi:hypothetical protein